MDFLEKSKMPIVAESERHIEIYELYCRPTGKAYVGQAVSHILNHGKYRRFKTHVSEAFSSKADFGGTHIDLATSREMAENFIYTIKKNSSETSCCGEPLRALTTTYTSKDI